MIIGMNEQDLIAYIIFGLMMNFLFSIIVGMYLTKNIGFEDMVKLKGDKELAYLKSVNSTFVAPLEECALLQEESKKNKKG